MSSIYVMAQPMNLPGSDLLANLGGTDGKIRPTDTVGIAKETAISYPVSYPNQLVNQLGQVSFFVPTGGLTNLEVPKPTPTPTPDPSGGGITIPIGGGGNQPSNNSPDPKSLGDSIAGALGQLPLFKVFGEGGLRDVIASVLLGMLAVGLVLLGGYVLFK